MAPGPLGRASMGRGCMPTRVSFLRRGHGPMSAGGHYLFRTPTVVSTRGGPERALFSYMVSSTGRVTRLPRSTTRRRARDNKKSAGGTREDKDRMSARPSRRPLFRWAQPPHPIKLGSRSVPPALRRILRPAAFPPPPTRARRLEAPSASWAP